MRCFNDLRAFHLVAHVTPALSQQNAHLAHPHFSNFSSSSPPQCLPFLGVSGSPTNMGDQPQPTVQEEQGEQAAAIEDQGASDGDYAGSNDAQGASQAEASAPAAEEGAAGEQCAPFSPTPEEQALIEQAEALKADGNESYRRGEYHEAIAKYWQVGSGVRARTHVLAAPPLHGVQCGQPATSSQ